MKSTSKTTNAPKLRFPEFTDDWEIRKLGDLLDLLKDGTHGTHKDVQENGIFLLSAKNIKNGKVNFDKLDRKISLEDFQSIHKNFSLRKGDVLLTIVGSIGETAVLENIENITFQRSVAYLRPKKELMSDFLFYTIQTKRFQNELKKRQVISAQPGIYLGDLSIIPTHTTKTTEQTTIGNFFRQIDKFIALHQGQLDKVKTLKKGLLQKMFPAQGETVPQIRFPQFTDDWEQCKLGEVVEINPKSELPEEFEYVDLEAVVGTEMISHRTEYKNSAPSRAQRLAQMGDIFYQTVRPYQKNNYLFDIKNNDKNFVFSTGYAQLRPSTDNYFLFSKIQEDNFVRKVLDKCTGTSYPVINAKDLSNIEIQIPTNPTEQTTIGNFFRQVDGLITLHQRKLAHLKTLKKALLQQMFV